MEIFTIFEVFGNEETKPTKANLFVLRAEYCVLCKGKRQK